MFMVFLSGRESVHGFFNCLFIQCICIAIVDPINREIWDPINLFSTATFLCPSYSRTWIFMSRSFSRSMILRQGIVSCSLCWYLWNCWPSPFKISRFQECNCHYSLVGHFILSSSKELTSWVKLQVEIFRKARLWLALQKISTCRLTHDVARLTKDFYLQLNPRC